MSKCRRKKRNALYFLGAFMLVMAFCMPVAAGVQEGEGEYEIYPTPQSAEYKDGTVNLTEQVNVVCGTGIDDYTKTRISDTLDVLKLTQTQSGTGNITLTVGIFGSGDAADIYGNAHNVDREVYNEFDAYTMWIEGSDIVILGKNTDAAYFGVTTLKRIFEQLKGKNVRELTIKDYSDIEFRGFIEGYYGNPWSHEDRIDLMEFGSEIKMNQYVFAPKDDPYHNAKWRELYPTEEDPNGSDITDIAALAKAGNESKCFFVYALHTFMNSPITEATYENDLPIVKAKFRQVIDAGVRQIAILEDDASANGRWSSTTIARLLTDITAWLEDLKRTTYPDLKTDLLFCPGWMAYANGMSGSGGDVQKIQEIYNGSPDNVRIIMTGGKVWGEVNDAFSDRFYNKMAETEKGGGYPYLWVNWPCNDNTRTSQIMGGHNYILHEGITREKYQGIILNPIQESEPSKVGIFTAADYTWKIWQTESEGDQAWEDSFKYIDHMTPIESDASLALKEVAKHQIAQSPNQPQVPFEESVDLKPILEAFKTKLNNGMLEESDIGTLQEEFKKIADASAYYLEQGTNRRMAKQMTPFLSCLKDMTQADIYLLDALKTVISDERNETYHKFMQAQMLYEQSKNYAFQYYDKNNPPTYQVTMYAMAGRKYIKPFTEEILSYVSEAVNQIVNPEYTDTRYPVQEVSWTPGKTEYQSNTKDKLIDGDDDTYLWFGQNAAEGDYIQVDLGEKKPVGVVRVLVGNPAKGNNKWKKYHLAYSQNGTDWEELDPYEGVESGMDEYSVDLQGVSARYLRLVCDAAVAQWIMFSEFTVYPYDIIYTNVEDADWGFESELGRYALQPKQNASLQQGEYVGLKLDRIHEISNIAVTGANTNGLVLETSVNAKEWTTDRKGNARYIRLINKGTETVTFSLDSFIVTTNEIYPKDFASASKEMAAGYADQDARSTGKTRNWVDGNKGTKAKYCYAAAAGDYVVYDLGQEMDIRSMKIWVGPDDKDYPRQAKVQGALTADSAEWTDIFEITGDASDDSFDTKAVNNGWTPGEGAIDVNYVFQGTSEDFAPVKARYIRLYFETRNAGRFIELSEIEINDNEYLPQINDPTFELGENLTIQEGFEPQKLNDGDITTAFQPAGTNGGSFIYHLSDVKEISRINILQNGSAISNAVVSVRTGKDVWEEIGTLDESYSAFYVKDLENIFAIKFEWKGAAPMIYEIIMLENTYADMTDYLEKDIQKARDKYDSADKELQKAKEELEKVRNEVKKAEDKVKNAPNEVEKLRAEVELLKLYAQQSTAEAEVAEKEADKLDASSAVSQATVRKLQAMIDAAPEEDKEGLQEQLEEEQRAVTNSQEQADKKREEAIDKKAEQTKYEQEAIKKNAELKDAELKNTQQQLNITSFKAGSLSYKVTDASAKTVSVTGPLDKKKVKTVSIASTVSYGGITWSVTEISASAFKGCKNLKKVTIGSNVTKIGNSAFAGCKKLKTVNMKKATKIASFGKKSFKGIDSKAKITVPKSKKKAYVKKLKKTGLPKTASVK